MNTNLAQDKYTLHMQDSDSAFYDESAPDRVVEMEYSQNADGTMNYDTHKGLALSRTKLEFSGEHIVWADSEYMKSLGNETNIYMKFCQQQRQG